MRVLAVPTWELPVIGYDNLLEQGTVTGVPVANAANAYDWLTHDSWTTNAAAGTLTLVLANAMPADYFAFFAHTLHSYAATIKLQYKTGAAWVDVPGTTVVPGDGKPILKTFTTIHSAQWRVDVVTNGTAVNLGVVSFGKRLKLQRGAYVGFMPPRFARRDTYMNAQSQDGHQLGRSLIRTGIENTLALDHLTVGWVRSDLEPFLVHSRTKSWFLLWNPLRRPDEAAYCWTTGMPQPNNTGPGYMGVDIAFEGRVE